MGEPHDLGCLGVEDHDACTCVDVLRDRISTLERERDEYRDRLRAALSAQTYVAPIELRKQLDAAERERDEAQARVESHARRTMDALKRAQKAERERNEALRREADLLSEAVALRADRDEARRVAERYRDEFCTEMGDFGDTRRLPWEREEVGG